MVALNDGPRTEVSTLAFTFYIAAYMAVTTGQLYINSAMTGGMQANCRHFKPDVTPAHVTASIFTYAFPLQLGTMLLIGLALKYYHNAKRTPQYLKYNEDEFCADNNVLLSSGKAYTDTSSHKLFPIFPYSIKDLLTLTPSAFCWFTSVYIMQIGVSMVPKVLTPVLRMVNIPVTVVGSYFLCNRQITPKLAIATGLILASNIVTANIDWAGLFGMESGPSDSVAWTAREVMGINCTLASAIMKGLFSPTLERTAGQLKSKKSQTSQYIQFLCCIFMWITSFVWGRIASEIPEGVATGGFKSLLHAYGGFPMTAIFTFAEDATFGHILMVMGNFFLAAICGPLVLITTAIVIDIASANALIATNAGKTLLMAVVEYIIGMITNDERKKEKVLSVKSMTSYCGIIAATYVYALHQREQSALKKAKSLSSVPEPQSASTKIPMT